MTNLVEGVRMIILVHSRNRLLRDKDCMTNQANSCLGERKKIRSWTMWRFRRWVTYLAEVVRITFWDSHANYLLRGMMS